MTDHPVRPGDSRADRVTSPCRVRKTEWVRIRRQATGEVGVLERQGMAGPQVVSFHCPSCPDPDNSRLVGIWLPAEDPTQALLAGRKPPRRERFFLHVTRAQISQILESFGRHDNWTMLLDIGRAPDDEREAKDHRPGPSPGG